MEPVRVVIAEDEFFTRQGIVTLLNEPSSGCVVVGQAENGLQAIELVEEHKPDVLLLDISMPPGIDGVEVIRRLRRTGNTTPIVALTHEKRMVKAVEMEGGNGFIPKDKYQMFIPTLQCVARTGSKVFINPETTDAFNRLVKRVEAAELNDLEMEVLRLIGYKNEEVGRRLHKTLGRIRNLVTEIYFKLDIPQSGKVSQRIQAIDMARLYGILEEPEEDVVEYD